VHGWTRSETEKYAEMLTDKWIYTADSGQQNFEELDCLLQEQKSGQDRLQVIQKILVNGKCKNRFFIGRD